MAHELQAHTENTAYTAPPQNAQAEAKQVEAILDFMSNEELAQYKKDVQSGNEAKWEARFVDIAREIGSTPLLVRTAIQAGSDKLPSDTSNISEAQFNKARADANSEIAQIAVDAVGLGIGLAQAIGANKKLKGLKAPQFKTREQDFSQLDNLINEVRKKSSGEMPGRERAREREFDEIVARAGNTAKQFGVQGSALVQAATVQASKERRAGELDDAQISKGYTQLLANLLQMKEGMLQHTDRQRERAFGRDYQNYMATQQALGQQKAAGFQNIYQAGSSLIGNTGQLPAVLDVYRDARLGVHKQQQDQRLAEDQYLRDQGLQTTMY